MTRFTCLLLFVLMLGCSLKGQPAVIFYGGIGHGNSLEIFISNVENVFVKGGDGSGYDLDQFSNQNNYFYEGGLGQGYSFYKQNSTNELVFALGGIDDGYHMEINFREFIWTGDIGEDWNVGNNWNYGVIPDINRKTIIPANVPNWPHLNAGIFAIGANPDSGSFTSGELWVQEKAQLVTKKNNFVQNYGSITVNGLMVIINENNSAFINKPGSTLSIKGIGILECNPN